MTERSRKYLLAIVGVVTIFATVVFVWLVVARTQQAWRPWLAALNVGQGDAILFSCTRGEEWLVDGGRDSSVLYQLGKIMPPWDRTIEWVVLTHPHADHASGLVDVLERYRVEHVLMLPSDYTTSITDAFAEAVAHSGAEVIHPLEGWHSPTPCATVISSPSTASDPNEQSIVLRATIGKWKWMLMGDATEENEKALLKKGVERVDVLKVGHHGSRTSSSDAWLSALQPQWAIISSGQGNDYGHPHKEVLERLSAHHVETHRTDREGLILFVGDDVPRWEIGVDRWLWPWWVEGLWR